MRKRIICSIIAVVLLCTAVFTMTAALRDNTISVKDWLKDYIADQGTTVNTDSQITNYIRNNKEQFFDVYLDENVAAFDGVSLLFNAMEDETCTVTFNCDDQSNFDLLLNEVKGKNFHNNKCIKFGKTVWEFTLVVDASGLDVQPRFQRQRPNLKETEAFTFIDAIPESFNIPVPIRVNNNSKAVLGTEKPSFNVDGMVAYEPDPNGTRVERAVEKITVTNLETGASISSEYGAVWYTKDGSAPGTSPSANQVSYTFVTNINALYSVSLEPITLGAVNGLPTLKLNNSAVDNHNTTPSANIPTKDEFNRTLGNSTASSGNINRGTNSRTDSIGSNAGGVDIRTAGRTDVKYGVRSTGFAELGGKIEVAPNPDTQNGFEVDYYNVEIYHPVTCELMTSKDHLSLTELNNLLRQGVAGKTKIYVAYKNTFKFLKTDSNGNPLKNLNTTDAPEFTVYSNQACTQAVGTAVYDKTSGMITLPALSLPTGNSSSVAYFMKETKAPAGYVSTGATYKIEYKVVNNKLTVVMTELGGFDTLSGNGTESSPYMIANKRVGYTMVKYRVTRYDRHDISKGKGETAGDRTEGIEPYPFTNDFEGIGVRNGFVVGNEVDYAVVLTNTGDYELYIKLIDRFEEISRGGFRIIRVTAVDYEGKPITIEVDGTEARFTLPVNNPETTVDESVVTVTYRYEILKDTPILRENSNGKVGYTVYGYLSTATSTAEYRIAEGEDMIRYAENANGQAVAPETANAIFDKNSSTKTPVSSKEAANEPNDGTDGENNNGNGSGNNNGSGGNNSGNNNNGNNNGNGNGNTSDDGSPKSGDSSRILIALAILVLAVVMTVVPAMRRKAR